MRYLIVLKGHPPFYTDWYDYENLFNPDTYLYVFDRTLIKHTTDGRTWVATTIDHL